MELLFLLTGTTFLTWWFLKGLLNPFIKAAVGIVITGVYVVISFFLTPFLSIGSRIIQFFLHKIPKGIQIVILALLGAGIFALDHSYGIQLFERNETLIFYPIGIMDRTYWVSQFAFWTGGFFILLSVLYLIGAIFKILDWLLNRIINVSIIIYR